ncbi:AMP-binding protein [candidate division CSSED10-310 bacterium]|uniref:AMP-binding protein n=1 Tax=candidate division CSSED10-310 bacterium TaxID=2855610 RepID=A0ABV6YRD1_UNCC1
MSKYNNLLECAYHWEQTSPQKVFLTQPLGGGIDNVKDYTWQETLDQARRMATYLQGMGLPDQSKIAICSKNCAHWIMADLAIWMAGFVSVPVFPVLTPDTVKYTLEHSESKLLFVGKLDPVWDTMKSGVPEDLPKIAFPLAPQNDHPKWDDIVEQNDPLKVPVDRSPDDLATIIYTSGSTGLPKGAMHDFRTLLECTEGLSEVVNPMSDDRYLSYLPIAHGMERWLGECVPLFCGEHVFYAESLDTFLQDLQRARPTLFLSVPRLWLKFQSGVLAKLPPKKFNLLMKIPVLKGIIKKKIVTQLGLDQVRFAGSGSAPLPKELMEWYRNLGLELLEGYGMTENFNYSHLSKPGHVRPGYIGTPYNDVECRISDLGEVEIKSPGNMMGYYKMPEETKASFTDDGFLKTGDRGEIDDEGRLKITGRTKEIFKTSKGKYIAPAPIENKLVNHHRIEMCLVSGSGNPQPHALIQLSEDSINAPRDEITPELEEHLSHINTLVEHHERLDFLVVITEAWLPENGFLTPTMKIKRNKIEEAFSTFVDKWYQSKNKVIWH